MKLILVTGLSGAGKSVALRTLEDVGYEAIDNLPLSFIPAIAAAQGQGRRVAIGADIRSRDFSQDNFVHTIKALKSDPGLEFHLVFLDCADEVLERRFTETRRRHPLAQDRPVTDGIRHERALLSGIRELADLVLDTSMLAVQELRRVLTGHFAESQRKLAITVLSFSYRHGLPREADMVFDARFLRNPHYVEHLRDFTGRDAAVGEYIAADPSFAGFLGGITSLVEPLLPRFVEEGKHYLTIAIGCTGGRHRSVYTAERLAAHLREAGHAVELRHREVG